MSSAKPGTELFRKAGSGGWIDEAYLTAHLDRDVAVLREQIRQREALRAVIVRPMSPLAAPEIVRPSDGGRSSFAFAQGAQQDVAAGRLPSTGSTL